MQIFNYYCLPLLGKPEAEMQIQSFLREVGVKMQIFNYYCLPLGGKVSAKQTDEGIKKE